MKINELLNKENNRNVGLDLLKIISMIMVCVLHILNFGGLLNSYEPLNMKHDTYWLLEILCYSAVNCFVLISGYVNFNRKFKISHILSLWLRVVFYSIIIYIVYSFLNKTSFTFDGIKQSLFPLSAKNYWFFTAYIGMYLLSPLVNKAIESFSKNNLVILNLVIFFIFSVLYTVSIDRELFNLSSGYSTIWLLVMYFFGASLSKLQLFKNWKKFVFIAIFFGVSLLAWLSMIVIYFGTFYILGQTKYGTYLIDYCSPFMVIQSISLLYLFKNINFKSLKIKNIITYVSSLSFSCYLIHENPSFRIHYTNSLLWINNSNIFISILLVLTISIALFIVTVLIDIIRDLIFKVLKIDDSCKKTDKILEVKLLKNEE